MSADVRLATLRVIMPVIDVCRVTIRWRVIVHVIDVCRCHVRAR